MNEDGTVVSAPVSVTTIAPAAADARVDPVTSAPVSVAVSHAAVTSVPQTLQTSEETEGNTNPSHPASDGPLAQMDSNNGDMCCDDDDIVTSEAQQASYPQQEVFVGSSAGAGTSAQQQQQLVELHNATLEDKLAQHCREELLRQQQQQQQQQQQLMTHAPCYTNDAYVGKRQQPPSHRKETPIPCPRYPPAPYMDAQAAQRRVPMKHARPFSAAPQPKVNQHDMQNLCQEARSLYSAYAADCAAQNMPWPLPFSPFPYDEYINKQAQLYESQGRPYSGVSSEGYPPSQPFFRDEGGE